MMAFLGLRIMIGKYAIRKAGSFLTPPISAISENRDCP
jgi:hypothetical protein